jgi:AAA+ superfamily predicted ATPase
VLAAAVVTASSGVTGDGTVSVAAVTVVSLPLAAVYYDFYTPGSVIETPASSTDTSTSLDPEVVKKRTEGGSTNVNGTGHPAYPPGEGPRASNPTHSNDTPGPQNGDEPHDTGGGLDPGDFEYNWTTDTGVDFDDIGGMHRLKEKLRMEVIKPLEEKDRAEELGIAAPNLILYGPPGTGKTFTAEALATELDLPFAMLSGSDVTSKWINESATKVNTLFNEAKTIAAQNDGAVIFLDELDSVLKHRGDGAGGHEEDNKVVNEFLTHLEDTEDHDIVFIGATNRLESLDDAGIRSGRIDEKIHVGEPDADARESILAAQLDQRTHDVSPSEMTFIASKTDGLVAADLETIVKKAAKRVFAREEDTIRFEDLEAAVEEFYEQ